MADAVAGSSTKESGVTRSRLMSTFLSSNWAWNATSLDLKSDLRTTCLLSRFVDALAFYSVKIKLVHT